MSFPLAFSTGRSGHPPVLTPPRPGLLGRHFALILLPFNCSLSVLSCLYFFLSLNFGFLLIPSLVLFSLSLQVPLRHLHPNPRLQHPKPSALALTALLSNKSKPPPRRLYQDALGYDRLRCGAGVFPIPSCPLSCDLPPTPTSTHP